MKDSKTIIEHIIKKPRFKKIGSQKCFKKLKSLLPPRMADSILFVYQKNSILFFALNHPAMKMEFNYNLSLIKRLLKELQRLESECANLNIKDIKFFVSNKMFEIDSNTKKEKIIRYKERSLAKFKNRAKNEKLAKIFEEIREIIAKNGQ
jgi:hypothetical protein